MKGRARSLAFSLVEVLIAIAVIAFTLPAIIALLASTHTHTREAADRHNAMSAVASAEAYLGGGDFATILSKLVAPGERGTGQDRLYVSRDLTQVGWASDVVPAMRYYALTLERNEQVEVPGSLVITLRVEWPAPALDSTNDSANWSVLRTHTVLFR